MVTNCQSQVFKAKKTWLLALCLCGSFGTHLECVLSDSTLHGLVHSKEYDSVLKGFTCSWILNRIMCVMNLGVKTYDIATLPM